MPSKHATKRKAKRSAPKGKASRSRADADSALLRFEEKYRSGADATALRLEEQRRSEADRFSAVDSELDRDAIVGAMHAMRTTPTRLLLAINEDKAAARAEPTKPRAWAGAALALGELYLAAAFLLAKACRRRRIKGGSAISVYAKARKARLARGQWELTDELRILKQTADLAADELCAALDIEAGTSEIEETAKPAESKGPASSVDNRFEHSSDFTTVVWNGQRYTFAKGQQADAVRALWNNDTLSATAIGMEIGTSADRFRLRKVFERNGKAHPAWGKMIESVSRGVYAIRRHHR